jgi:hypothetical protein
MANAIEEMLTSEVMLFQPIMQQSYLQKEFDRKFSPIATIQPGSPIEFLVKASEKLYLDLNSSRIVVRGQIVKKDGTALGDAAACKTGAVNLLLHSLFKDVTVQFNNKTVSDPSNMYAYRAYLETLVNASIDAQKSRLQTEGWFKDDSAHIDEDAPDANKGLVSRRKYCVNSSEFILIGRPHADMFHIDKLIPPGIDLSIKFLPNDDKFILMTTEGANFGPKVVIKEMSLIIHTKQLSNSAEIAHRALVHEKNMRLPYTRVLMKHIAIPSGSSTICLDNIFTGPLPDLVLMGFVSDAAFAGSYTDNPFNFQNFKVKRLDMFANGNRVSQMGYRPDFNKKLYEDAYFTFQEQLGFDQGDRCVNITPDEWANGFNLYSFKITDGPIGSGTAGPRSHSETGSARLEIDFETPPTANLKLIIMHQYLGIIEVDEYNNIIVS